MKMKKLAAVLIVSVWTLSNVILTNAGQELKMNNVFENVPYQEEGMGKRKLVDVLKTHEHWDRSAQSVIIAEGLLMYLSPAAVQDLFCQCAIVAGVHSRIAFSYIPTGADGRPDAGRWTSLMLWLQKVVGEPWTWSIRPEELDLFLEKLGWTSARALVETTRKHGVEFYAVATK